MQTARLLKDGQPYIEITNVIERGGAPTMSMVAFGGTDFVETPPTPRILEFDVPVSIGFDANYRVQFLDGAVIDITVVQIRQNHIVAFWYPQPPA